MSIIAGVDIGNATTEIVIVDDRHYPPIPIAWDRAPTQGLKGSEQATAAAARLLRRMERALTAQQAGLSVDSVVVTRQFAVHTQAHSIDLPPVDTGRLMVLGHSLPTPAGSGLGLGSPVPIEAEPVLGRPVVLIAADPLGYRRTIQRVQSWAAAGADLQALLLAGDEAHIVGLGIAGISMHPLLAELPILDRIDPAFALNCEQIAVEARATTIRQLSDALWLRASFGLDEPDNPALQAVTQLLRGAQCAAIGLLKHAPSQRVNSAQENMLDLADGARIPILGSSQLLRHRPVGTVRGVTMNGQHRDCEDAWVVETDQLVAHRLADSKQGGRARQLAISTLQSALMDSGANSFASLAANWSVNVVGSETEAAYAGACTTPGANDRTQVIDLGGGTIDVVAPQDMHNIATTAAGCGQLLTTVTASVLGISSAMAEWVKRGPARRAEAPQLIATEDGQRNFASTPLPGASIGWLVVPGPAGPLPFTPHLPLGEWRRLRLALKEAVIGQNLARALPQQPAPGTPVVLVGGPAGDDELFESLVVQLPWALLGRGDVAGKLGHRWAVAYGLTVLRAAQS